MKKPGKTEKKKKRWGGDGKTIQCGNYKLRALQRGEGGRKKRRGKTGKITQGNLAAKRKGSSPKKERDVGNGKTKGKNLRGKGTNREKKKKERQASWGLVPSRTRVRFPFWTGCN